jgi:putative heme degradation protein
MGKANEAQCYGAALTYSRRYSTELAESVACNDDDEIEKAKKVSEPADKTYGKKVDFRAVREKVNTITDTSELAKYWQELNLSEKQANVLKSDFAKRKAELGGKDGME